MIIQRCERSLGNVLSYLNGIRNISNKSCVVTKIHRACYLRTYPTLLVQPDGSTFKIRYHEPRKIIKLPYNMDTISEEQRNMILEKRKPKKKVIIKKSIKDDFDRDKYLKYFVGRN